MAALKSGFLTVILSVAGTLITWAFLAGSTQARIETRLADNDRRIMNLEGIRSDLTDIKATLAAMQAEQRILHDHPSLGRR